MGLLFTKDTVDLQPFVGYRTSASAILIALDRIRDEHLLDEYDFEYTIMFDECVEMESVGLAVQMIEDDTVDVIIGPVCNTPAIAAGVLVSYYNLPIFLWGETTASTLGVVERFPTALALSPNSYMLGKAVQAVMEHFEWTEFALLYSAYGDPEKCAYVQSDIQQAVGDSKDLLISFVGEFVGVETEDYSSMLTMLKTRARSSFQV